MTDKATHRCTTCGLLKEPQEFDFKSIDTGERMSRCKECRRDYRSRASDKIKAYQRDYTKTEQYRKRLLLKRLKAKCGDAISDEQLAEIAARRYGACDICRQESRKPPLCIDHDHKTGRFRGLLCYNCNLMLGNALDSISTLQSAIDYLSKSHL